MPVFCQSNWPVANIALNFPVEAYGLAACYLLFSLCIIYYDLPKLWILQRKLLFDNIRVEWIGRNKEK